MKQNHSFARFLPTHSERSMMSAIEERFLDVFTMVFTIMRLIFTMLLSFEMRGIR